MNVVAFLQESSRIFGVCPCCGELFRLSDAQVFIRRAPPRTPFDELEDARRKLLAAIERYEAKEEALRAKALELGQAAARRRLKQIAGPFVRRRIDPQDVKVVFSPVEFIAFRGMSAGMVSKIELIDRPAKSRAQESMQNSLAKAVAAGHYEWKVLRITEDGRVVSES